MKTYTLAELLGPLSHLGQCSRCHKQFMSTQESVAVLKNLSVVCAKCASKSNKEQTSV